MRLSKFWLTTQKETPAEAEIISHQLMLRAGMIRQTAVGIYSWLPIGLRVLKKVENIVREEMNRAGAIELLMPGVQPAELWQESGRWYDFGPLLLRIKDRHEREYCLSPTHEEVITDLLRRDLGSYKNLPVNLYQIQTKFRDETRPRFGVMRGREFLMKDGYSFHLTQESLEEGYQIMYDTYCRIFDRLGLDYRPVMADNGSIGGTASHEFHVLAATGEDDIVFSAGGTYAANMEKASAKRPQTPRPAPGAAMVKQATPQCKSIASLTENYHVPAEKTVKTLIVEGHEPETVVALVLRGDHELNEVKAEHLPEVAVPLTLAGEKTIRALIGAGPGSLGPVGLDNIAVIVDEDAALAADFVCGANEDGYHYFNVNWERDVALTRTADLRKVTAGDEAPDGSGVLSIKRGIEVGHIFQLGSKYSQAMGLKVQLEDGSSAVPLMGCYGIGVSRIVAAAIEQNHDERGIIWPESIAPFSVAILPVNPGKSQAVAEAAEQLYQRLLAAGVEVLLDDRGKRPGFMFADMDLLGIPQRVVISDKTLANRQAEYKHRRSDTVQLLDLEDVFTKLTQ